MGETNKMKKINLIPILLIILIVLMGCKGDKVTGKVIADLTKNTIKNGESINLKVDGENTGNVQVNVILKIIPEDVNLLKITYPGSLEDTLQPGERIGRKLISIQGYTEHSQTKLWIKTQLVDKTTNNLLDEDIKWITIVK